MKNIQIYILKKNFIKIIILFLLIIVNSKFIFSDDALGLSTDNYEYSVYVYDSKTKEPLQDAKVVLKKDGMTGGYQFTNHFGKIKIRNVPFGKYICWSTDLVFWKAPYGQLYGVKIIRHLPDICLQP